MPNRSRVERFRTELLRRGLPPARATRAGRELADHWEDLKREALERGVSPEQAEEFATRSLGEWDQLAAAFQAARSAGGLLGRHPICALVLSPVLVFTAVFATLLLIGAMAGYLAGWPGGRGHLNGWEWMIVHFAVQTIHAAALIGTQAAFSWLALRRGCGLRRASYPAIGLSIYGFVHHVTLKAPALGSPGSLIWGYGLSSEIWPGIVPLASFAVFCLVISKRLPQTVQTGACE